MLGVFFKSYRAFFGTKWYYLFVTITRKGTIMENNFEQIVAAQRANTEVLMALIRTAFNGVERLTALNMAATRDFFASSVANTQQALSAKDANELTQINSALAQPSLNKWMEYSRSLYDLASDIQREVTSVVESQYSSFAQKATDTVEKVKTSAPVGGEVFAATLQSFLNASNQAFGNMSNIAKQFSDITEASIKNAGTATSKALAPSKKSK